MRFGYKIGFSSKWILTGLRSYCAKDVLLEPSPPDAGRAYILEKKSSTILSIRISIYSSQLMASSVHIDRAITVLHYLKK